MKPARTLAAVLAASALLACGGSGDRVPVDAAPDFALLDVSPSSPSSGRTVSPRDYLGHASAWYFGHAT